MNTKPELREKILEKRSLFSNQFVHKVSSSICKKLLDASIANQNSVVHSYLAIKNKKEIDSIPYLKHLWHNKVETWTSYLPQNRINDGHCQLNEYIMYDIGRYGIPLPIAPVENEVVPSIILVPCLAVDKLGNRLGYGSGWYDWFLDRYSQALRVGLIYDEFLLDLVPVDKKDQQLDMIVTEKTIIQIKRLNK